MAKNFKLTEKQYKIWTRLMSLGKKIFRCHQSPDRSFFFHGMQFPLCARCTGILFGFVLAGPVISIFTLGDMLLSMVLILVMLCDGSLQFYTKYESNNYTRLLTGLGFGYACFSIILHIVIKMIMIFS